MTTTRRVLSLAAGLLLSLTAAPTAFAAPANGTRTAAETVAAAACPGPGTRLMTPSSSAVYLVDPEGFIRHIPNQTAYFQLWDSWSGITTISDSEFNNCWEWDASFTNAYLVRAPGSSRIYLYDSYRRGYRWIINASVFEDKYKFSWNKVRTQELDPDSVLTSLPWR
ncbi:hypothetical protein WB401_14160 [Streptomyces brasiliscabiei]|uniref:Secreted protein n=1 Tax=Streptomyces brasiliscabiei TaxID=2736302 RepID=A0ABU8GVP5_9ACTN